jgi:ATP/maltotriose-dependent transcriptional regulator MalT
MPVSTLVTKLYVPLLRPNLVVRPRLLAHLDGALTHKVTLVAATAGSGKSTLVSAWLAEQEAHTAWLSLDAEDGEIMRSRPGVAVRFRHFAITLAANGESLLTGTVADQAALHGVLRTVRDLGLPLLEVRCLN